MSGTVDLVPPRVPIHPLKLNTAARDICEGWVLKKRRKKMQGWARRYFVLKPDGVLVYSTHPGSTPRDSIPLRLATITSSERAHQITVDSGTKTFHIRCFAPVDFEKWMKAFRTFLVRPDQAMQDDVDDTATEKGSVAGGHITNFSDRLFAVMQDMDSSIKELEALISASDHAPEAQEPTTPLSKKQSSPQLRSKKEKDEKDHHHHNGKGDHGVFGLFHRKTSNKSVPTESSLSDPHSTPHPSTDSGASTPSTATFPTSWPSTSMAHQSSLSSFTSPVRDLRSQHSHLISMLERLPITSHHGSASHLATHTEGRESQDGGANTPPIRSSALERVLASQLSSGNISAATSPRSPRSVASRSSFVPRRRPMSLNTVGSAGDSVFYDAEDGGLEFVDFDGQDSSRKYDSDSGSDEDEAEARAAAHSIAHTSLQGTSARTSKDDNEDNEDAYGGEDRTADEPGSPSTPKHTAPVLSIDVPTSRPKLGSVLSNVSSSSTVSLRSPGGEPTTPVRKATVVRRTRLPAPTAGEQMSLFTMLKRNIGKDLATVAFPVTFNEPLSLLQHAAEDLEYLDVIQKAVAEQDPVARLAFVAAFAVSGYACTKLRASRKPFNPLLGETFEDIRYNFVSEKVSHHPPVVACHAHGEGWEFWSTSGAKNKFWGKSLEIIPVGTTYLKIGDETYSWQKPSSFMRNLIAGEKYLEHCGFMTINTSSSSLHCTLEFKEGGFWGTNKDEVFGKIVGADDHKDVELRGRWNSAMSRLLDASGSHLHVLWRATPLPEDAIDYYGFTQFAIGLNEITGDIQDFIPPTDSRLRPDQRALEDGDVDRAEEEKARVEEAQRERRKLRAERGETWRPKWFQPKDGNSQEWEYVGGYWEAREKQDWGELEELW